MKVRLFAAAVTIGLASVAWTTSAVAGNPHGTPPGQQKASASATVNASTQTNASAHANGKAHVKAAVAVKAKGHATTKAHGIVKTQTQAQPTVSAGVAPSSATSKDTLEAATSTKTKLYGNGKTAGQIAVSSGYTGNLHGPGNSQPHKVVCGAHEIDVHALKAHGGAAACASSPSVSTSETSSVTPAQANVAATAAAQAAGNSGVLSAQASAPAKTKPAAAKTNKHASGVLSAKAALAATAKKPLRLVATVRHGNLPFTGLGLWMPMVLGLGLIATGLAMRRKGNSLA